MSKSKKEPMHICLHDCAIDYLLALPAGARMHKETYIVVRNKLVEGKTTITFFKHKSAEDEQVTLVAALDTYGGNKSKSEDVVQ